MGREGPGGLHSSQAPRCDVEAALLGTTHWEARDQKTVLVSMFFPAELAGLRSRGPERGSEEPKVTQGCRSTQTSAVSHRTALPPRTGGLTHPSISQHPLAHFARGGSGEIPRGGVGSCRISFWTAGGDGGSGSLDASRASNMRLAERDEGRGRPTEGSRLRGRAVSALARCLSQRGCELSLAAGLGG